MTYTINTIQDEMTAAGSHWWDHGTMRYFQCRVGEKVYQGDGGIYFVTSERNHDEPRKFSVRQYLPEAKDIDTLGEFNSLTRAQAHRVAAGLAGPAAIVAKEAHKKVTDAEQLVIDIERNGGHCNALLSNYLIRLATHHHKMMEDYCNGADIYGEDDEPLPKLELLRANATKAAKDCWCGVVFSGDPRGCTMKLTLPNGETNGWGKDGWCVPTRGPFDA